MRRARDHYQSLGRMPQVNEKEIILKNFPA
jgi:hypothetical protein